MPGPATVTQPTSLRLVATLTLASVVSGVGLVVVFLATQPRIERNQAEALQAAVFRVLPGTARIEALVLRQDALVPYEGPAGTVPREPAVFAGYTEGGDLVGYAVPGEGPGFMDTIKLIFGFEPTRRVIIGMEVLDSRETPGLGDKILFDPGFLANFRALEIAPRIVPVKKGKKTAANQVDCITGATISSEAVVGILNKSAATWAPRLAPPAEAPAEGKGDVAGHRP